MACVCMCCWVGLAWSPPHKAKFLFRSIELIRFFLTTTMLLLFLTTLDHTAAGSCRTPASLPRRSWELPSSNAKWTVSRLSLTGAKRLAKPKEALRWWANSASSTPTVNVSTTHQHAVTCTQAMLLDYQTIGHSLPRWQKAYEAQKLRTQASMTSGTEAAALGFPLGV